MIAEELPMCEGKSGIGEEAGSQKPEARRRKLEASSREPGASSTSRRFHSLLQASGFRLLASFSCFPLLVSFLPDVGQMSGL